MTSPSMIDFAVTRVFHPPWETGLTARLEALEAWRLVVDARLAAIEARLSLLEAAPVLYDQDNGQSYLLTLVGEPASNQLAMTARGNVLFNEDNSTWYRLRMRGEVGVEQIELVVEPNPPADALGYERVYSTTEGQWYHVTVVGATGSEQLEWTRA